MCFREKWHVILDVEKIIKNSVNGKDSHWVESVTGSQDKFGGGESNDENSIYGHTIW